MAEFPTLKSCARLLTCLTSYSLIVEVHAGEQDGRYITDRSMEIEARCACDDILTKRHHNQQRATQLLYWQVKARGVNTAVEQS